MSQPVLSVCLITYNHGRYIREALNGIVMQRVNFSWEIIVADDCSKDDTRAIVKEYADKHPGQFKLVFQEKNVGPARNWMDLLAAATGKYVAYMEGDDRWNDPEKLQKQVDFLEHNPEYVISCHDAQVIDEHGTVIEESKLPEAERKDYSAEDLKRGAYVLSVSMCYRNVIKTFPEVVWKMKNGDTLLTVLLGEYGACKFQHEIKPASYRRHTGGVWSMKSVITQWRTQANTYEEFSIHFQKNGDKKFMLYYLDLLVKKQLDIYRWEKENGEEENATITRKKTLSRVMSMRGMRTYWYVRKRFRNTKTQS
jgi:glycosyltransferase involved in cell wall biosynthesis